jgi:shikimate kinase
MKIYLIGMPGSGKTTIGKKLAELLKFDFFDTDAYIETQEKTSIATIFEQQGESYFRQKEHETLLKTIYLKNTIISTGGGLPCFFDNMEIMQHNGITIFIDTLLDVIAERLQNSSDRPLLAHNKLMQLQQLYDKRIAIYRKAQYVFENTTAEKIAFFLAENKIID